MCDMAMNATLQDIRIDFQFSKGAFDFSFLPFTIPYPVPFKALGDETKVHRHRLLIDGSRMNATSSAGLIDDP